MLDLNLLFFNKDFSDTWLYARSLKKHHNPPGKEWKLSEPNYSNLKIGVFCIHGIFRINVIVVFTLTILYVSFLNMLKIKFKRTHKFKKK